MGRPRNFREETVLDRAAEVFIEGGYEGTSIDDLVKAVNLHRGSLYKAFGSKRGLFLAVLRHYVQTRLASVIQGALSQTGTLDQVAILTRPDLDLLLIAALERGHQDPQVAALVRQALTQLERAAQAVGQAQLSHPPPRPAQAIGLLGARLYERLHNEDPMLPNHLTTSKET